MKNEKDYGWLLILIVLVMACLASCTDKGNARNYGGTETIDLEPGERVITMTWKKSDIWILTKRDTTKPTTYTFQEKSSMGVWEGKVIVNEK